MWILVLDRIEEYIHCVVLGGPRSESEGIFQRLGLVIAGWFHSNRCLEDVYADPSRETRTVTLV